MTIHPQRTASAIAVMVFVLAAGFAFWFRAVNPYGIWLYTPSNWCASQPTASFALAFGLATATVVIFLGLLALILWRNVSRSAVEISRSTLKTKSAIAAWSAVLIAVFALFAPLSESVFPNLPDPKCAASAP